MYQTTNKLLQFQPKAELTVANPNDDDGGVINVQWQWYRSSSSSAIGTAIDGEDGNTYAVLDTPANPNDVGSYLRVVATYEDATGPGQTASFVSKNPVQAERRAANSDPEFSAATLPRSIRENTVGNVGQPVRATDADTGGRGVAADILTYSIPETGLDNDSFSIDRATGQLMVKKGVVLNYEDPLDESVTLADKHQRCGG